MAIAAYVVLGFAGCASSKAGGGSASGNAVGPTPVIVVDVRTPAEFAEGHIGRAVVPDIKDPGFDSQVTQLDRSATYLVYCHSGNRSGQATAFMASLGFTNVNDLDGGISAWMAAGAPVVT